jgi:L-ascorbate metabolism protein UlaG (beta-lactamase superfamily)
VIHDLYFSPIDDPRCRPQGLPVRVRWLGTAGFALEHDGFVLLIDPYVTRASLAKLCVSRLKSDYKLIQRFVPRADAVVVGHSHFDHVLDVPAIAAITGAKVYESESVVSLCKARGIGNDSLCDIGKASRGRVFETQIGPFQLRFVPSIHSSLLLHSVPFPGEISAISTLPSRLYQYRCGSVYCFDIRVAGRRIYHLGSAELLEMHTDGSVVDLLLLCAAGWRSTSHFVPRVLRALAPRKVILSHWDDFTRPLDKPVRRLPFVELEKLRDLLYQTAKNDIEVGALPLLGDLVI